MHSTPQQHQGGRGKRALGDREVSVLVIDDDADTHDMLGVLLAHAGFTIATASNGREALNLLTTLRPRMILLDVEMPVMTGAQFREAQRRDADLIRIPTVVMTGSREEPMLDPGVAEILRKPFSSQQLISLVRRFCDPDRPS